MSATSSRGPGRPPKPTPETLERQQQFLSAIKLGATVKTIAESTGFAESWVRESIGKARAGIMTEEKDPDIGTATEESQPKPPRRMNRRTVLPRAWDYIERRPAFGLDLGANALWLGILVATHEEFDGFRLRIGYGSRFQTRAELALLLLGQRDSVLRDGRDAHAAEIERGLEALFNHGRLLDLDGQDIGIPHGIGLVPGENSRGEPIKPRVSKRRPADDQGFLPFRPHVVGGQGFDAGEIPPSTPVKSPILPADGNGEIPGKTLILPLPSEVACTAAAAAKEKEIHTLNSSSSNGSPADTTPVKLPILPLSSAGEIPLERSPSYPLAVVLKALTPPIRQPSPGDVATVQGWLDRGDTAPWIVSIIQSKMAEYKGTPIVHLAYFDSVLVEARAKRERAASEPRRQDGPLPTATAEPEEPITGTDLAAQLARVKRGIGRNNAQHWLKKCTALPPDADGTLTMEFAKEFDRSHVSKNYDVQLTALWRQQDPSIQRVAFTLAAPG